jgi:hypothetical protein
VTLILATGSNYRLGPDLFLKNPKQKLDPSLYPHSEVSSTIKQALKSS